MGKDSLEERKVMVSSHWASECHWAGEGHWAGECHWAGIHNYYTSSNCLL